MRGSLSGVPGATSGEVRKAASWSMLLLAIRRSISSSAADQASRWRLNVRELAVSSPVMRKARRSSRSNTSQTHEIVVSRFVTLAAR